mgnify:CR=1 FL=1
MWWWVDQPITDPISGSSFDVPFHVWPWAWQLNYLVRGWTVIPEADCNRENPPGKRKFISSIWSRTYNVNFLEWLELLTNLFLFLIIETFLIKFKISFCHQNIQLFPWVMTENLSKVLNLFKTVSWDIF